MRASTALLVRMERLAAAVDAAAGAGHDLDEVQILAAGANLFHELARALPRPLTTAAPTSMPPMLAFSSLAPSSPRRGWIIEPRQLLAGDQEVRGAHGGLHDAAGGAEDLARRGALAERRVGHFGLDAEHAHAAHAQKLRRSSRVVST
jgi:hypothetical protein